ncbi:hypothetical protein GGF50DRAFT_64079 [Schizophyllum commune]
MKAQVRSLFSKHGSRKASKHDHATTSTRPRATPSQRLPPQLPPEIWAHIFTCATGSVTPSSWDGPEDEENEFLASLPRAEEPKLGVHPMALMDEDEEDDDFDFLNSSSPYGRDSAAGSRGFLAPRPGPPDMATKMALMLTCRRFASIATQHLFHTVYISHKEQARLLAQRLQAQDAQGNIGIHIRVVRIAPVPSTRMPPYAHGSSRADEKEDPSGLFEFDPSLYCSGDQSPAYGGYDSPIPSVFDRVDARDVRAILLHAPNLEVYEDHAGVRYSLFDAGGQCTPDAVLDILASRQLTRLAWTTYAHPMPLAPALVRMSTTLRWLELQCLENEDADEFGALDEYGIPQHDVSAMNGGMEADAVCLAELQTLKLTLSNPTLRLLAAWRLPKLRNLSILASDFAYAGEGFGAFFESHGSRIRQLELGHSSATIEEYWLSRGLEAGAPGGILRGREGLLAGWCSNLKEFICSADAEWNWHDPDRIRPHTLLKSHPTLLFIGVRDIEKRLRDDLELARARRRSRRSPDGVEVHSYAEQVGNDGEEVFFRLLEQMQSLLRKGDFPALKFVRDMGCAMFSPPSAPYIPEEDLEAGFAAMKRQVNVRKHKAVKRFLPSPTATPATRASSAKPTRSPSLSGVKPRATRQNLLATSQQVEALTLATSSMSLNSRAPLLLHEKSTRSSTAAPAAFTGSPPDEPVIAQPAYYVTTASRPPHAVFIHPPDPEASVDVKGKGKAVEVSPSREVSPVRSLSSDVCTQGQEWAGNGGDAWAGREPSPIRFAGRPRARSGSIGDESIKSQDEIDAMYAQPGDSYVAGVTVTIERTETFERKHAVSQTMRKSLETIQQKRHEVAPWEAQEEQREQEIAKRLEVVPWEEYEEGFASAPHTVIEHDCFDDEWDTRGRPRWRKLASASAVALRSTSCLSLSGSPRTDSTLRPRSCSSGRSGRRAESPIVFKRAETPTGPWPCETHVDLYGKDGAVRYGDSALAARAPTPDMWNTRTGSPIHFAANDEAEDDTNSSGTETACESEDDTTDSGIDVESPSALSLSEVDLEEMNASEVFFDEPANYSTVAEWVLAAQKQSYGEVNVYDEQSRGEAGASFIERTLSFRRGSASSEHMTQCKKAAVKVAQRLHHAASFNVASATRPKSAGAATTSQMLHPSKSSSVLPTASTSATVTSNSVGTSEAPKAERQRKSKNKRKTLGFHNPFASLTHGIRMSVVREQVTEDEVPAATASSPSSTWEFVDAPAPPRTWTVLEDEDVGGRTSRSSFGYGSSRASNAFDDDDFIIETPRPAFSKPQTSLHPLAAAPLPKAALDALKATAPPVKAYPTAATPDPQAFYAPPSMPDQPPNPYATLSRADQNRILTFYRALFERCRENGVWLEGREGVNVTVANMRRVRAGMSQ